MKMTTVDQKEIPGRTRPGEMDAVVEKALTLKGTATLKLECADLGEAKKTVNALRGSLRRLKLEKEIEICARRTAVFVYPIREEEKTK